MVEAERRKVLKIGSSFALTIPKSITDELNLKDNSMVKIALIDRRIIIELDEKPVVTAGKKRTAEPLIVKGKVSTA